MAGDLGRGHKKKIVSTVVTSIVVRANVGVCVRVCPHNIFTKYWSHQRVSKLFSYWHHGGSFILESLAGNRVEAFFFAIFLKALERVERKARCSRNRKKKAKRQRLLKRYVQFVIINVFGKCCQICLLSVYFF